MASNAQELLFVNIESTDNLVPYTDDTDIIAHTPSWWDRIGPDIS